MGKLPGRARVLIALAIISTGPAGAEDAGQIDKIVFAPIESRTDGHVQVVGGEPVDAKYWRTLLIAQTGWAVDPDGKPLYDDKGERVPETCTASLVGPGVALTAAHCIDKQDGAAERNASLQVRDKDKTVLTLDMRCRLPSTYVADQWKGRSPRNSHDFALCTFAVPPNAPLFKGMRYEVIEAGNAPNGGQDVLLTGYGCKGLKMGANGVEGETFDQIFTIANAAIDDPSYRGNVEIYSNGTTRPVLCFGDSGGPLMIGVSTDTQGLTVPRRILAVNSSIERRDAYYASQMSPLTQVAFRTFLAEWRLKNPGAILCGDPATSVKPPCRN